MPDNQGEPDWPSLQWEFCVQQGGSTCELYIQTPEDAEKYIQECEDSTYDARHVATLAVYEIGGKQYMEIGDALDLVQKSLDSIRHFVYG